MSKKKPETKTETKAEDKQPTELKKEELDEVQGGRKAYDLNPNDLSNK